MKMFKVYAKCAISAHPIQEADKNDLQEAIDRNLDEAINAGKVDCFNEDDEIDDEKYSAALEKLEIEFDRTGCLNAGDYQIIKAESADEISRPNMCGYDWGIVF